MEFTQEQLNELLALGYTSEEVDILIIFGQTFEQLIEDHYKQTAELAYRNRYRIKVIDGELCKPFFAEVPVFVWGNISYDCDGDCARPTDRDWSRLTLRNWREDRTVSICNAASKSQVSIVASHDDDALAAAFIIALRTGGRLQWEDGYEASAEELLPRIEDVEARLQNANATADKFGDPQFAEYDHFDYFRFWKYTDPKL